MVFLLAKIVSFAIIITICKSQGCNFNYVDDFADKEPVLFNNEENLLPPNGSVLHIRENEIFIVACPGNSLALTKANFEKVQCLSRNKIRILSNGQTKTLKEIECVKKVLADVQTNRGTCASNGVYKYIGYTINGKFNTLYKICYNENTAITLYAINTIYGCSISDTKRRDHPSFLVDGLPPGLHISNSYTQKNQIIVLDELLGQKKRMIYFIQNKQYFAKGHLIPDRDATFSSYALSTYYYINAVPQWQNINAGNWYSLDRALRKLACQMNDNFEIITGTFDTLKLSNDNGNWINIFLSGNKLPVPMYIWKVVKSLKTGLGIAFVSWNNPVDSPGSTPLCNDICNRNKWGDPEWKTIAKGMIYCCTVTDLNKRISMIPSLSITGILQGPTK